MSEIKRSTFLTNRTTTYESLLGLVYCIYGNKEQYIAGYNAGTHDYCGQASWILMNSLSAKKFKGE